jgi:hypothetical protein
MTHDERDVIAITEQIADWKADDLDVRLDERVLGNVQLTGGTSRNGHSYSTAALEDAARLYARKPVFLDHAANLHRPLDRSARDLAGWIVEARYQDGRIRGDIQLLDTEAGRTLLALMTADTPAVGMSHVILARKSSDGAVVERIHDVISVDAVVFPATTSGMRESQEDDCEPASEEIGRITKERDEWREKCEALEIEIARLNVERELAESNLPAFALTEAFRAQLNAATDPRQRSRLIAEQRDFLLRARQRAPCSRGRRAADDADADVTRRFVQAVKRGVRR